jgi:hypothetical protein
MSKWTTDRPPGAPDIFNDDGSINPTKLAEHQAEENAKLSIQYAAVVKNNECRIALSDAIALASPLSQALTPEETALVDSQVSSALAGFRALIDPPADVVALAAAIISLRSEL